MLKTAAGVAGGALLFSPVGMPIVHGVAGLAVASLGVMAAGSVLGAITDKIGDAMAPKENRGAESSDSGDRYDRD
ncbi:hypothetical protein [Prosthecochloris sp. GSB1]|uniref:hypothetical protein n=1 Tax=Prosthecochloris sp. GSB1 TaxID=281093 RepID=UPI0012946D7A|nr:hypothetical protein [Prosthecochloris sp. GSB1]